MVRMPDGIRMAALATLFVWQSGCGGDKTCRGVIAIGAEAGHAVLLKEDGSLWEWEPGSDPVRGSGAADAVGFANAQLCLRLSTGGVRCDPPRPTGVGPSEVADPQQVSSWYEDNPTQVSICAVTADGTLTCRSPSETVFSPRAQEIRNVAVGAGHFCAVTVAGSMVCQPDPGIAADWSAAGTDVTGAVEVVSLVEPRVYVVRTTTGQLLSVNQGPPDGVSSPDEIVEIPITGIDGEIKQLVAGFNFACALRTDGAIFCWSDADYAHARVILRTTTNPERWVPQRIESPRPATALAAGDLSVCALLDDATVWCWGAIGAEQKDGGFVMSCG
jgi:alpha-tubulin suppressor-like RCC1 family protein